MAPLVGKMAANTSVNLEDKLRSVTDQISSLEEQIEKFLSDNKLRTAAGQVIPHERDAELYRLQARLDEFRRRHLALALNALNESSTRLETATRNLKESSDSQASATEKLKESSDSQVKTIKRLLRSSVGLENLTAILVVVTLVSVFVIVLQASGVRWSSEAIVSMATVVVAVLLFVGAYVVLGVRESRSLAQEIEVS